MIKKQNDIFNYHKIPIYNLEYAQFIDENNNMRSYTVQVTIPKETLKKLNSRKMYAFYKFNDSDGLIKYVAGDMIISLSRAV